MAGEAPDGYVLLGEFEMDKVADNRWGVLGQRYWPPAVRANFA